MSEVPSQTEKEDLIDMTNIGGTSDEEMLDDTCPCPMIKVKQEIIDYFTGLTNHDSNDNDFQSKVIIHENDDSEKDNDDDRDADQIKMQYIYEQHERNRYRKQVSEVDSQIKMEPDDTEDTGNQGIQHKSLETVDSIAPLSTEDAGEHSTIPSSKDLPKVGAESQQIDEEEPQMVIVKRLERPPVSKGEIQLYVPPGRQKDRGRSISPVSMKPLGQELSHIAVRKSVQEFQQIFLDHAVGSSAEMSMSQPEYNVIIAKRRLAESWKQVEADDRAAREQMKREEAECITQAKEEKAKQEAKCIEEQLKPILEFKQKFLASRKQSIPEAPAAQEAQELEVEKTEPKKVDSSVGQLPKHSGEGVEITIPFGCK